MSMDCGEEQLQERIVQATHAVISALADKDYVRADRLCSGVRLGACDIERAVREYGREICMPPDDLRQHINVIQVEGARPRMFSVWVGLWTREEGRSDLTLQLTLVEGSEAMTIQIDDLHVL